MAIKRRSNFVLLSGARSTLLSFISTGCSLHENAALHKLDAINTLAAQSASRKMTVKTSWPSF